MADMTQTALVADLQAILKDAAIKFTAPADFVRHLTVALGDLSRLRPYHKYATVSLLATVVAYNLPADFDSLVSTEWGNGERMERKPWDSNYPGRALRARSATTASGKQLLLIPAPTAAQITDLGADYGYTYRALHAMSDTVGATTVSPSDRHLLLIRATAQALQELANNGIAKPVELGQRGVGSMPKNGTPAALAEQLMDMFWAAAA